MVKLTSFDLYCAYNVFYFTFRRNPRFLMKRKALGMNWRKNKGRTKPRALREAKLRETAVRTTILQEARPCCRARKVAQGPCASRHGCATTFLGARSAMRRGQPCVPHSGRPNFLQHLLSLGPFCWVIFDGQLGFSLASKKPSEGRLD